MNRIKKIYQGFFSIRNVRSRKVITFLGIKLKLKCKKYYVATKAAIKMQDNYDLKQLEQAKKIVVFLISGKKFISGGILAIFQLCKITRKILSDAEVIISTYPGDITFAQNNLFENDEKIYRWEQIRDNAKKLGSLTVHVPEYYAGNLYLTFSPKDVNFFKKIDNLSFNILNQNIEVMSDFKKIKNLFNLTSDVSHSTCFAKYSAQEVCNKYRLPLYEIPSFIDLENCVKKEYKYKTKRILYSNDSNPNKDNIVRHLRSNLKNFEIEEINNLSYKAFLNIIADSMFCISFGEGFDGYYIQPYYAQSIGITVYNDTFFPSGDIKKFPFVYGSYEQMYSQIIEDIKKTADNENIFKEISQNTYAYFKKNINKKEQTVKGLSDFYNKKYKFLPLLPQRGMS